MPKPGSSRDYSVAMTVTPEFELDSFDCKLPEVDFDIWSSYISIYKGIVRGVTEVRPSNLLKFKIHHCPGA